MMQKLLALGALASVPQVLEFGLRFGRTIILARSLSSTEFGMSVGVAMVITIAHLFSDMGLDKFVMSSPRNDNDRDILAAAHALQIARSLVFGVAIFVAAPWIARLLNAEGHGSSFQWCAVIVLLQGFSHLEMIQRKRDFLYRSEATARIVSISAAFIATYPAVWWFKDHHAMIVSLFIDAVVYAVASHYLAHTRYSIFPKNKAIIGDALRYGLPLTLNGVGLALNSQLDRVVVSHWLGLRTLGIYSNIANLALVPLSVIGATLGPLAISFLARVRRYGDPKLDGYLALMWAHSVVAAVYATFVAATLDILAPTVFGSEYAVSPTVQVLVTGIVWLRIVRGAPTARMLVEGHTGRLTIANFMAGAGLISAGLLLPLIPRLETALGCLLAGDILSLAFFFWGARGDLKGIVGIMQHAAWSGIPCALTSLGLLPYWPDHGWARVSLLCAAAIVIAAQVASGLRDFARKGLLRKFAVSF